MRVRIGRAGWAVALAAVFGALLVPPSSASAQGDAVSARGGAGEVLSVPLRAALDALPVAAESREGYERTKFRHWVDADSDGCNTRAEVLLEEAVVAPEKGAKCLLTGGEWYSSYDNLYVSGPAGLDIDHLVPLAEAWDSGASAWSAAERQEYANDLGDPRALLAVTAKTNRSKADKDPAGWLPPYEPARCRYVTDWIAVKLRWRLAVDPVEQAALVAAAFPTGPGTTPCPNVPVRVTRAR